MSVTVKYIATHAYKPDNEADDEYIAIDMGDVLEVRDPEKLPDFKGTVQEPHCWLKGRNVRSGKEGLFPGTYVLYKETVAAAPPPVKKPQPPPPPKKPRKFELLCLQLHNVMLLAAYLYLYVCWRQYYFSFYL